MLSFSSCVVSSLKADFSFLSSFNHPFPLQHFHISQKSCSDVISVVCITSFEGHRRSLSEFFMDREKGGQRVATEKDYGEYDQWLGNEPSFCLKFQHELCYRGDNLPRPIMEHWIALAFDPGIRGSKINMVLLGGDGLELGLQCRFTVFWVPTASGDITFRKLWATGSFSLRMRICLLPEAWRRKILIYG
ncbi:hypothetical protein V6N13_135220 [Hibiscus sabdariffa]|uniref:Uncharacterized protein n=1 Tax=Hibiscus sabdariffa TaxID=183260 RepID=A0ABR2R650_9ROSI